MAQEIEVVKVGLSPPPINIMLMLRSFVKELYNNYKIL